MTGTEAAVCVTVPWTVLPATNCASPFELFTEDEEEDAVLVWSIVGATYCWSAGFTQLDWERIDHDVEIGTPIKLETAAIKLEAADESLPF